MAVESDDTAGQAEPPEAPMPAALQAGPIIAARPAPHRRPHRDVITSPGAGRPGHFLPSKSSHSSLGESASASAVPLQWPLWPVAPLPAATAAARLPPLSATASGPPVAQCFAATACQWFFQFFPFSPGGGWPPGQPPGKKGGASQPASLPVASPFFFFFFKFSPLLPEDRANKMQQRAFGARVDPNNNSSSLGLDVSMLSVGGGCGEINTTARMGGHRESLSSSQFGRGSFVRPGGAPPSAKKPVFASGRPSMAPMGDR